MCAHRVKADLGLFSKGSCRCKCSCFIQEGLQYSCKDTGCLSLDEIQFSPNWSKLSSRLDGALACGAEKWQLRSGLIRVLHLNLHSHAYTLGNASEMFPNLLSHGFMIWLVSLYTLNSEKWLAVWKALRYYKYMNIYIYIYIHVDR